MRVCLVKFTPLFFFASFTALHQTQDILFEPFQDTEDEDWVYELKAQFQEVEMVDLVID